MAGYHEKVGQTAFFEKPILRKQPKRVFSMKGATGVCTDDMIK